MVYSCGAYRRTLSEDYKATVVNPIVLPLLGYLQFLLWRLNVYTWLWRGASALKAFFFLLRWAKRLLSPVWLENSFLMGSSKPIGRKGVCFDTFKPELAFRVGAEKSARLLKIFDVVFDSINCCVVSVFHTYCRSSLHTQNSRRSIVQKWLPKVNDQLMYCFYG